MKPDEQQKTFLRSLFEGLVVGGYMWTWVIAIIFWITTGFGLFWAVVMVLLAIAGWFTWGDD